MCVCACVGGDGKMWVERGASACEQDCKCMFLELEGLQAEGKPGCCLLQGNSGPNAHGAGAWSCGMCMEIVSTKFAHASPSSLDQ